MLTEVVMPQLSLSMQFGIVTDWYKAEGDRVEKGELICDIEGDKATIGIDSPIAGTLRKIVAQQGEEFPVRQVLCYIGDADDVVPGAEKEPLPASAQMQPSQPTETRVQHEGAPGRASPVAKRLASELGVDLTGIIGTGPDGLIGKEDVLKAKAALDAAPSARSETTPGTQAADAGADLTRTLSVTGVKRLVGERMLASHREIPHIHLTVKCILTQAMAARRAFNASQTGDTHVTVSDLLLWALARTLPTHPLFNSAFQDDAIQVYARINLGVAIASERGLIVGVIPSADTLTLLEIARRRQEVIARVSAGRQTPADTTGATFTLTNLGMLGVLAFDPIVPPGNSAILGGGQVTKELVVDDNGRVGVEETVLLTLACDHRVADGAEGARFLADLVATLTHAQEMFPETP